MKVTPVKKNFNRHQVGDVFEIPDKAANILIKLGKLRAVTQTTALKADESPSAEISPRTGLPKRQYNRRDLRAES